MVVAMATGVVKEKAGAAGIEPCGHTFLEWSPRDHFFIISSLNRTGGNLRFLAICHNPITFVAKA